MDNDRKIIADLFDEKKSLEQKLAKTTDLLDYYFKKSEKLYEMNEKLKQEKENQAIMANSFKNSFLKWLSKAKELEEKYDNLAKEFDRAINYIKIMRKFSDNAEN